MDILKTLFGSVEFVRKCFFCGQRKGLKSVQEFDMYDVTKYYYHDECLHQVLREPEKNVKFVDRAIVIADLLAVEQRKKDEEEYRINRQIEKAKRLVSAPEGDKCKRRDNNA